MAHESQDNPEKDIDLVRSFDSAFSRLDKDVKSDIFNGKFDGSPLEKIKYLPLSRINDEYISSLEDALSADGMIVLTEDERDMLRLTVDYLNKIVYERNGIIKRYSWKLRMLSGGAEID